MGSAHSRPPACRVGAGEQFLERPLAVFRGAAAIVPEAPFAAISGRFDAKIFQSHDAQAFSASLVDSC
jgi:hypothetical protein